MLKDLKKIRWYKMYNFRIADNHAVKSLILAVDHVVNMKRSDCSIRVFECSIRVYRSFRGFSAPFSQHSVSFVSFVVPYLFLLGNQEETRPLIPLIIPVVVRLF